MKRFTVLLILLAALMLLAACAPKDNPDALGTPEPTAEATQTPPPSATAEPTPRTLAMVVETAAPGATVLIIDPSDKPTRAPVNFIFEPYESQTLGVAFNVPFGWVPSNPTDNTVQFTEPDRDARDGYAASVTLQVIRLSNNQTEDSATAEMNNIIEALKAEWPGVQISNTANNVMLDQKGPYVNIRIQLDDIKAVRGRVSVFPVGSRLYVLRYMAPANYNTDYEKVYREIRGSIQEI